MSSTYAPRPSRGSGSGMSATTLLAAKVGFASAALALAASVARLAVPHLVSVGGAVVPRVWAVARFWLAPPYLFVTVHLIILVIWKLSDHKHFHAQAAHHKDPWPVTAHQQHAAAPAVHAVEEAAVKAKVEEEFGAFGGGYQLEPESSPDSSGADSCVTTESDEDNGASSAAPTSYYSAEATTTKHRDAPVHVEHGVLQHELSLPAPHAADCEGGDDDLDATWNAIMQKTRSAPAAPATPAPPPPAQQQQSPARPPPRARDPSVGAEEMNRRFDDFIKKNRNSFGRQ